MLLVRMVFLCGNDIVKLVDIDSADQLHVCKQTCYYVHVVAMQWHILSWRTTTCFLQTIMRVEDFWQRHVWRSFGQRSVHDKETTISLAYYPSTYSEYVIVRVKVVKAYSNPVQIIRPRTINASLNIHFVLVSGVCST